MKLVYYLLEASTEVYESRMTERVNLRGKKYTDQFLKAQATIIKRVYPLLYNSTFCMPITL